MKIVLTIAGFDPSGCAGLLADTKTFEAHGVYGMAVCTANTVQNVAEFFEPGWKGEDELFFQLSCLQRETDFNFVKIGLIRDFDLLNRLIDKLTERNKAVKIIWDPVCMATASYSFHTRTDPKLLLEICRKIYLITPNLNEIAILVPDTEADEAGRYLSQFCNVLIKGGHSADQFSTDTLYQSGEIRDTSAEVIGFRAEKLPSVSKRGTGCVLSAAILSNLALCNGLTESCRKAKDYIGQYLLSGPGLIGNHDYKPGHSLKPNTV